MNDDSARYIVALPGGLAVLVFLWWLCREWRMARAAKRASVNVPIHIVVIQDKQNAAVADDTDDHSLRSSKVSFCAYEDQQHVIPNGASATSAHGDGHDDVAARGASSEASSAPNDGQ